MESCGRPRPRPLRHRRAAATTSITSGSLSVRASACSTSAGTFDASVPRGVVAGRASAAVGRRGRLLARRATEPSQRRRHRQLCHAGRHVSARQRLPQLNRGLRRSESRVAWLRGARRPRWDCAATIRLAHSVTGEPPPPPLSRLAGYLRAPALAVPRKGPIAAHEPCDVGVGRASASVAWRGRL